jgi:hypothetical protein
LEDGPAGCQALYDQLRLRHFADRYMQQLDDDFSAICRAIKVRMVTEKLTDRTVGSVTTKSFCGLMWANLTFNIKV